MTLLKHLIESFDTDPHRISEFLNQSNQKAYYSKRDNCGVAAIDYIEYMKKHGVHDLKRVEGTFKADVPVVKKLDFFKSELDDMVKKGYNHNTVEGRLKYTIDHNLLDRQKEIPHYWVTNKNNDIIDPSGKLQFIDSKLATDLKPHRYIT